MDRNISAPVPGVDVSADGKSHFTGMVRRSFIVWFLLVGITIIGTLVGYSAYSATRPAQVGVIIALIIAFGKVQAVGEQFMELRHAPIPLRVAFSSWVVASAVLLILFYLFP